MVQAGQRIYASDVNLRVGSASLTADSSATSATIATESGSLLSVVATLVDGETYDITLRTAVGATGGIGTDETSFVRIREDTSTGTQLAQSQVHVRTTSVVGFAVIAYAQYTAVADGAKTFVVTLTRAGGTVGAITNLIRAAASRPTWLTVDLVNP